MGFDIKAIIGGAIDKVKDNPLAAAFGPVALLGAAFVADQARKDKAEREGTLTTPLKEVLQRKPASQIEVEQGASETTSTIQDRMAEVSKPAY